MKSESSGDCRFRNNLSLGSFLWLNVCPLALNETASSGPFDKR